MKKNSNDFRAKLVISSSSHGELRYFDSLEIGCGWLLSPQASKFMYCSPRETLTDPYSYTAWEIAFLHDNKLVPPPPGCPYSNRWEGGESPVAGWVEVAEVQEIYEWMLTNHGSPLEKMLRFIENPEAGEMEND